MHFEFRARSGGQSARLLDDVAAQSDLFVRRFPRQRFEAGPVAVHFNQLIKDEILYKHAFQCVSARGGGGVHTHKFRGQTGLRPVVSGLRDCCYLV